MLRFDMCDLDRDSSNGLVGSANSGFKEGLGCGDLSKGRGELRVRLCCVDAGTFHTGRLLTSGNFCCAETGEARGDVCTPVETMPTRCATGCAMAGADDRGLSFASEGFVFLIDAVLETTADGTLDRGFEGDGARSALVVETEAKASSASACTTRLFKAGSAAVGACPNSNFWPRSCSSENSSRDGKRDASSSAAARRTWTSWESRAANGSEAVPRIGEALGFAAGGCWAGPVGLPRRIGVMSGICWTCLTGATFCKPTIGGEATSGSVGGSCWFLRASDCVRSE